MQRLLAICLVFSAIGLAIVWAFSGAEYAALDGECAGLVRHECALDRVFYSKKGNRVGVCGDAMLLLNDFYAPPGGRVSVEGKASKYGDSCWIFPDKVAPLD